MRFSNLLLAVVTLGILVSGGADAADLKDLKVLYVGNERAPEYVKFLTGKVAAVTAKSFSDFRPAEARDFDVVLFDWPQGETTRDMRKLGSPLGPREEWNRPTVLLGSAGLNLAVAWKLKGGSGCTCMDPLAYDLHEHPIFEHPFKIDRGSMVSVPTPGSFQRELKDVAEIKVLPLVTDHKRQWQAGWCTYSNDFAQNPDVEFFCGGVNHKTPTAAGLWRQGNLLHFGFEQSPAEMNDSGQHLLLNSIAYISQFTEDRPIAVTPSVFAGPIARPRKTVARWLRNPEYPDDFVKDLLTPKTWEQISAQSGREKMAEWAESHAAYLYPGPERKLEIDDDLVRVGLAFDDPAFISTAISNLRSTDSEKVARARRLLKRYVPCGPKSDEPIAWEAWWKENQPFLFASDADDYRWYVDPLAKDRDIPTKELRGFERRDKVAGKSTKR
jgi:hypothetical protein